MSRLSLGIWVVVLSFMGGCSSKSNDEGATTSAVGAKDGGSDAPSCDGGACAPQVLWDCGTDWSQIQGTHYPDVRLVVWLTEAGEAKTDFYLGTIDVDPGGTKSSPVEFSAPLDLAGKVADLRAGSGTFTANGDVYPLGTSGQSVGPLSFTLTFGHLPTATAKLGSSYYPLTCSNKSQPPQLASDCNPRPSVDGGAGQTFHVTPYGTGSCDTADFKQPYQDKRGAVDTAAIQTALQKAHAGDTVSLAPGVYCVTDRLEVPNDGVSIVGAGMAYPNDPDGGVNATVLEVPKAVVWNAWCSLQSCDSKGVCKLPLSFCPWPIVPVTSHFVQHFVIEDVGAKDVSVSGLTIYGNSDFFYPNDGFGGLFGGVGGAPGETVSVANNCSATNHHQGGSNGKVQWVHEVAGGISMGVAWTLDSVDVDSAVLWGYQERKPWGVIKNSVSRGPTCNDGIGGGGGGFPSNAVPTDWSPDAGPPLKNFMLGAGADPANCPGVQVTDHHWTTTFNSKSSVMDIMDTVGVSLTESLNESANHVTFEGDRDSKIKDNKFLGGGNIQVHANEEYAWNGYFKSRGQQLKAVSMPRTTEVTGNTVEDGGTISIGFDDPAIPTPCLLPGDQGKCLGPGTVAYTPMPASPIAGGHNTASGNTVAGSLLAGIKWTETSALSAGGGLLENNTVKNPVTCTGTQCTDGLKHYPDKGAGYDWSGIVVYKDSIPVTVTGNSLEWTSQDSHMVCGIQGEFASLQQIQSENTFTPNISPDVCNLELDGGL